jgi:hypothetical protein
MPGPGLVDEDWEDDWESEPAPAATIVAAHEALGQPQELTKEQGCTLQMTASQIAQAFPLRSVKQIGPPGGVLYFDLETVPDTSRLHLFDLPQVPGVRLQLSAKMCPPVAEMLALKLEDMGKRLDQLNPADEYLDQLLAQENTAAKPRSGVAKAIDSVRSAREEEKSLEEQRRKLLSVTPEYCRIAAIGWAVGGSAVVAELAMSEAEEIAILRRFWDLVASVDQICGFNVLAFDLPVILVRSMLLGVEPTKQINLGPFNNRQVVDLMVARYGKGGKAMKLKALVKTLGIEVPAGDDNGADVGEMLANDPERLKRYVASDVHITRALRDRFLGLFV